MEAGKRWRIRLLTVDMWPERHAPVYTAWAARGAAVQVETSLPHALARMRAAKFTVVLVPLEGGAGYALAGRGILDEMNLWARLNAPNYIARFIAYRAPGDVDVPLHVNAIDPLVMPWFPGHSEVERATDDLGSALGRLAELRRTTDHSSTRARS